MSEKTLWVCFVSVWVCFVSECVYGWVCVCFVFLCVALTRSRPQHDDDLNELSVTLQLSAQTSVSLMTVCECECVCKCVCDCVCQWYKWNNVSAGQKKHLVSFGATMSRFQWLLSPSESVCLSNCTRMRFVNEFSFLDLDSHVFIFSGAVCTTVNVHSMWS